MKDPAPGDRNRAFDLVILDFDGTLVDTRDDIVEGVNQALSDLGMPERPGPEIAGFIGRGVDNLAALSLPPDRIDLLQPMLNRFRARYEACFDRTSRPYPGVRRSITKLRNSRLSLALASNKPSTYISKLLRKFGLGSSFLAALGGDSMARKKPDPWCIDVIRQTCRASAERTLMVGDMRYDMETGVNAGTMTCGVLFGYGTEAELREAGAGHLVHEFPDLISLVFRCDSSEQPLTDRGSPPGGAAGAGC